MWRQLQRSCRGYQIDRNGDFFNDIGTLRRSISTFVAADQLLKGKALSAVQIAELQ